MKWHMIIIATLILGISALSTASTINRENNGEGLVDDATWRIHSKSADHVTYVRREGVGALSDLLLSKVDCNKTEESSSVRPSPVVPAVAVSSQSALSQPASSWRGRGSASGSSNWRSQSQSVTAQRETTQFREPAGNLQLRAGTSSSDIGGRSRTATTTTTGHSTQGQGSLIVGSPVSGSLVTQGIVVDGYDGDHLWKVTHRTDDHITYTKRNATGGWSAGGQGSSFGQGEGQQGQLTRLGAGSDSVLARVVKTEDEELTEESLLQSSQGSARFGGHSTNELVHPYVKRVNVTAEGGSSSTLRRGGATSNRRKQLKTGLTARRPAVVVGLVPSVPTPDDTPPRVGDEINGWRVISKSGDHISWQRVGSIETSSSSVSSGGQLSLRSLDSSSSQLQASSIRQGSSGRGTSRRSGLAAGGQTNRRGQLQLIPSAEGELVEGFPRVFITYSKSLFSNNLNNIEGAGTIRTTLSNTQNWQVGDELAGWKVVSIDDQGLVWEKISDSWRDSTPAPSTNILNEEDLLALNSQGGQGQGQGLEGDSQDGTNKNKGPAGTWYLDKETKNSVTWRRDGVPADLFFDMEQYPRVGDTDSLGEWKVESKSKEHITWVRLRAQPESDELTN